MLWENDPDSHCDVPGLGKVMIAPITVGVMVDTLREAREICEDDPAEVFFNLLVSRLLQEPKKTAEEVAELPEDATLILGSIAADHCAVSEEYAELSEDLPPRAKLYQAIVNYDRAWAKRLNETFADVNTLAQAISDSVTNPINEIGDGLRQMHALALKSSMPHFEPNLVDVESRIAPLLRDQLTGEEALAKLMSSVQLPLQDLVEQVTRVLPPEPFLSSAMWTTGLNAARIHTPSFSVPDIEVKRISKEPEKYRKSTERERLVDAYDILVRLEPSLRTFIEKRLAALHGPAWWRRAVPEPTRNQCEERKRDKETPGKASYPLLSYAYIDDCKTIIVKGDNWRDTFGVVFGDKNELEVCFGWVGGIRQKVAHMREIDDEEYLMFVAGAGWIQSRIDAA